MKKMIIFLLFSLLFLNVFCLFSSIQPVNAKQIDAYDTNTQTNIFNYDINMPLTNNSRANRLATENFEYETNTNLSQTDKYANSRFSLIVKEFNDVDFMGTNYTYKSKYCEITTLRSTGTNFYDFTYDISNSITLEDIRFRTIVKPVNLVREYGTIFFGSEYIQFYVDFNTREFKIISNHNSNIKTVSNFLPVKTTYEYLYLEYERIIPIVGNEVWVKITCFNSTGKIILDTYTQVVLTAYIDDKVTQFRSVYELPTGSGYKTYVRALDMNFVTDKYAKVQSSIFNYFYGATDLKTFYLTLVPYYVKECRPTVPSTEYYYATTVLQKRYLQYKTNATNTDSGINLLNTLWNANFKTNFYMRFEIGTNTSYTYPVFNLYFNKTNFHFFYKNYLNQIDFNGTIIPVSEIINDRVVLVLQKKNNLFSASLDLNNTIYTLKSYVNDDFKYLLVSHFYILNSEIRTLNTESVIDYPSKIDLNSDTFTFRYRISVVSVFATFKSTINIPANTISVIYDADGRAFDIISSKLISMSLQFERNSENGWFSITEDNSFVRSIFNGTLGLTDQFNYNFLFGKDGGNLLLESTFYTTTLAQVSINVTIHYVKVLSFTDVTPTNNLLLNKALEILIPLMIFGLIVIGFKSNSDSKYFGIIGLYVGIFVFYLMDYMSLLFMVLSFIFLTIGLYIIIKHEKGSEI